MKTRREVIAVALSAALFVLSLTQIGFYTGKSDSLPGWQLLLIGWMELIWWSAIPGLFFEGNWLAILARLFESNWLANPALLLCYFLILLRMYKSGIVTSYLSVIYAASFLTRSTITMSTIAYITGYGIGYWLWLASTMIMALSSSYLFYVSKREASKPADETSEKAE